MGQSASAHATRIIQAMAGVFQGSYGRLLKHGHARSTKVFNVMRSTDLNQKLSFVRRHVYVITAGVYRGQRTPFQTWTCTAKPRSSISSEVLSLMGITKQDKILTAPFSRQLL